MMGGGYHPTNLVEGLSATAAFISFINVFGGFIVTARMLDMFKRTTDPPGFYFLVHSSFTNPRVGGKWRLFDTFWVETRLGLKEIKTSSQRTCT